MPLDPDLVRENLRVLQQGVALLEELDDATYVAPAAGGGTIGEHVRHCADFYRCFLRGLGSGRVDYDRRERDPRVEGDRGAGVSALRSILSALAKLEEREGPDSIEVALDRAGGTAGWCGSTVSRELLFLRSHTIHHYALVAIRLRERGIEPPPDFGVAPSTLDHRENGRRADARRRRA